MLMAAIRLRPLLSGLAAVHLHLPCLLHRSFARRVTSSSSSLNMLVVQQSPEVVWDEDLTSKLSREIKREDERYQKASQKGWELNAALVKVEIGASSAEDESLDTLVSEIVDSPEMYNNIIHDQSTNDTEEGVLLHPRAPRLANLSSKVEEFARMKATQHFLTEGKLLSPHSSCFKTPAGRSILTDEEYIGGCCIGLCHDLSKHAVNRASNAANDSMAVPFIESCRDTAVVILDALLAFDFRNGPLRRKYDSLKYALKNLETVLYELSVAGAVGGNKLDGPAKKKAKTEGRGTGEASADSPSLLPKDDIEKIRERMEHRDKLRETLIKTCRDGQKQAKQAIFALHRNDMKTASTLLSKCEECVEQNLVPILREEPCLRSGSFTGVLEEYVEAKLFAAWLEQSEEKKGRRILLPQEIPLPISNEEFLGGLMDLTGEIGRYAVQRGTVRDKAGVELCLQSSKTVYNGLKLLGKIPGRSSAKKVAMVQKNVEKLERVLYEQSLMEMAGRKEFASSVEEGFGNDIGEEN